jgi:HEAT repeat protein
MSHVFISYVREDAETIDKLRAVLKAYEVPTWVDWADLKPGCRWKDAIRAAIQDGIFYLACFSSAYAKRATSDMNEELVLAIDELRQRATDKAWFIPVLLDDGEVPDRSIGGGETLRSLQWVNLSKDWDDGIRRILSIVAPDSTRVYELRQALRDPSARQRIRAADDLGALGTQARSAVPDLTAALRDENATVQAAAAAALGQIGEANERVISELVETLRNGDDDAQKHARMALVDLGAQAIPSLLQWAPDAIERIDDPLAVPQLIDAFENGHERAAIALGRLGTAARAAVPLLIKIRGMCTTIALGDLGDPAAIPELLARLRQGGSSASYAATALGKLRDPAAARSLLDAMASPNVDDSLFERAVGALLSIADPRAIETMIPLLIERLARKLPDERRESIQSAGALAACAEALGKIGRESFVPALRPLVSHASSKVRQEAAAALEAIGTDAARAALRDAAKA